MRYCDCHIGAHACARVAPLWLARSMRRVAMLGLARPCMQSRSDSVRCKTVVLRKAFNPMSAHSRTGVAATAAPYWAPLSRRPYTASMLACQPKPWHCACTLPRSAPHISVSVIDLPMCMGVASVRSLLGRLMLLHALPIAAADGLGSQRSTPSPWDTAWAPAAHKLLNSPAQIFSHTGDWTHSLFWCLLRLHCPIDTACGLFVAAGAREDSVSASRVLKVHVCAAS